MRIVEMKRERRGRGAAGNGFWERHAWISIV